MKPPVSKPTARRARPQPRKQAPSAVPPAPGSLATASEGLGVSRAACTAESNWKKAFWLLPKKERCLLRLYYYRSASQGELAGVMGITKGRVRRTLLRARRRASNPRIQIIWKYWPSLPATERRLVRFNWFWGLSLRDIVARGLVESHTGHATLGQLRTMMRRIQRLTKKRGMDE